MSQQTIKEIFKNYPQLQMSSLIPENDKEDPNTYYGNFLTRHTSMIHDKVYHLTYIMKITKLEKDIDYKMHDVVWYRDIMWHEDDFVFNGINFRTQPFDVSAPGNQELYYNITMIYTDEEAALILTSLLYQSGDITIDN